MRTSPRAACVVASCIALLGATLVSATPQANAEDLKDRQHQVRNDIKHANEALEESSAQAQAAAAALARAESKLGTARTALAGAQGRLETAQAFDALMQRRLDAAVARLDKAKLALQKGRAEVAAQRLVVKSTIINVLVTGDVSLLSLEPILESEDLSEMTRRIEARDLVVDSQEDVYTAYQEAAAALAERVSEVADIKGEIADDREAAAENLAKMQKLESDAEAAKERVQGLVNLAADAEADAIAARRKDKRVLAQLQDEADKIKQQLAALAEHQNGGGGGPHNSSGDLSWPTDSHTVTSPYGYRTHPIYGYYSLHDGIDIGAGCGAPLYASANGVVLQKYYQTAWGNRLIVNNGVMRGVSVATIYNHATSYVVNVGDRVTRGQVLGYVGTTGWSTGCHLHFTVMVNGNPVDPMGWL